MTSRRSTEVSRTERQPPVLTADRVIPAALAAGVLTADDVVRRVVEVRPIGRSHPVFRVSIDDKPVAVLKAFGPRRGDTDGEFAREAAVIALAAKVPALAALLPPMLHWRGRESVIATGFVDGATAASLDGLGEGASHTVIDWPTLARVIAPPLAHMHRETQGLGAAGSALQAPIPWGLRVFDGDASPDLWATPQLSRVLSAVAIDPAMPAAVRRARGAWRTRCLIHGDLKHENVLIRHLGGRTQVTFVDWEMARLGDPAWDLAALFVRQLLADAPSAQGWTDTAVDAAAVLIEQYVIAARVPVQAVAQRLVLYSGVWLIMTMLQFVSMLSASDSAEPQIAPMRTSARATLVDADRHTARIIAAVEEKRA